MGRGAPSVQANSLADFRLTPASAKLLVPLLDVQTQVQPPVHTCMQEDQWASTLREV